MARWEEALDAQLDTYRAYNSPLGRQFAEAYAKNVRDELPVYDVPGSLFRGLDERFAVALFNADPVYMDSDMQTVFEAAWRDFKPEPLQPTDLCTASGFMLLPRPVFTTDVHGKRTSFRAVLWEPVEMRHRVKNALTGEFDETEPEGGVVLYLLHGTGTAADEDDYDVPGMRGFSPFILSHTMPWRFGETDLGQDLDEAKDGTSVYRPVQCLWRLMMQTLAVHTPEKAGGQFRKRWERADMPEKRVTVVRLRRTYEDKNHDGEVGTVDWKSRWIVGGHWRNQWYQSEQLHRQIWISPYVKGPEELPLRINKTRVFEFVR